MHHTLTQIALLSSVLSTVGPEVPANLELESKLFDQASTMIVNLQRVGVSTVGILKFGIGIEGRKDIPNNMGRLNLRLAEKTEVALVYAIPNSSRDNASHINLLKNATHTAATIPGATHRTNDPAARERLFEAEYALAWCDQNGSVKARPDAFISGVAEISDDLRTIAIQLFAFVRKDLSTNLPQPIITGERFTAPLDVDDLIATGEGYVIGRRGSTRRSVDPEEAFRSAHNGRKNPKKTHPFNSDDRPLDLEILYGFEGRPLQHQPFLYFDEGDRAHLACPGAFVASPHDGQRVRLVVRRKSKSDKTRYGVLLRVNGDNTLLKQRLPDDACRLWVMEPDREYFQIDGFHVEIGANGEFEPFKVFDGDKAMEWENFYGGEVGIISLDVYEERIDQSSEDLNRNPHLHAIKKGSLPKEPAKNKSLLGQNMINRFLNPSRKGVIGFGQSQKVVHKTVPFNRASRPVFSGSVRYYKPSKGG